MQPLNIKPKTVIIISLVIGFLLGMLVTGFYTRYRIEELMSLNTKEGLKSKLLEVINPNDIQEKDIDSLVELFALRNAELLSQYEDSLNALKLDLKKNLAPKLTDNQKKKVELNKELGLNNKDNPAPKAKKIVQELRKDSITSQLIDSLIQRRADIRTEKKKAAVEAKMSERSLALQKRLNLSDSQTIQVDSINRLYFDKLKRIQNDTLLSTVQKGAKLRELRKQLHSSLEPILTTEQLEEYKVYEKERIRERIQQKRN